MSDGNGSKRELRSEAWFSGLNGERAGLAGRDDLARAQASRRIASSARAAAAGHLPVSISHLSRR
jgi:hypothetical protein